MTVHNIGPIAELRAWKHALRTDTWVQHTPNKPGERCVVEMYPGTVEYDGYTPRLVQASLPARQALEKAFQQRSLNNWAEVNSITRWNDFPGRTLEEVELLFDEAIMILEDEQDAKF